MATSLCQNSSTEQGAWLKTARVILLSIHRAIFRRSGARRIKSAAQRFATSTMSFAGLPSSTMISTANPQVRSRSAVRAADSRARSLLSFRTTSISPPASNHNSAADGGRCLTTESTRTIVPGGHDRSASRSTTSSDPDNGSSARIILMQEALMPPRFSGRSEGGLNPRQRWYRACRA